MSYHCRYCTHRASSVPAALSYYMESYICRQRVGLSAAVVRIIVMRHYLVSTSFTGCLPEDGHVVNSLRDAAESVRDYIESYKDAHKFVYDSSLDKEVPNPDFSVERYYSSTNKRQLIGAYVKWSEWGGGINISVDEINADDAKGWNHQ